MARHIRALPDAAAKSRAGIGTLFSHGPSRVRRDARPVRPVRAADICLRTWSEGRGIVRLALLFFFWSGARQQTPDGQPAQGEQHQVPMREGCQSQQQKNGQQPEAEGTAQQDAQQQQKQHEPQQGRQPVKPERQRREMEMGEMHAPS